MVRGFENLRVVGLAAIALLSLAGTALAGGSGAEICRARDDNADTAFVDSFFVANLKEHELNSFSRPLKASARRQAKAFLDQRIADKRAELCAARLKLAVDIKSAATRYISGDCAAAAVVTLMDGYAAMVTRTVDENGQMLQALRDAHLKDLTAKLFAIARGSTVGVEATLGGVPFAAAPQKARADWAKQEAPKLGLEANTIWGASSPLDRLTQVIAQEATLAKAERDAAKVRFRTSGKLSPTCKLK